MATRSAVDSVLDVAAKSDAALAEIAEQGLPTEAVAELRSRGLTFAEVGEIVIPPRTLKHRKARGGRLSTEESERVLRVARILSLADKVFGNHDKALGWLRDPDPRLNDRNCLSLLRTEAGGRMVEEMLWGVDEGVYS